MNTVWDCYEYCIAEHYLSALINGDHSGMTDAESAQFTEWETQARADARWAGWTVGHWSYDNGSGEEWDRCEVSGSHAMHCTLKLHVDRDAPQCSRLHG